jgi:hypothetical protein
VTVRKTRGRPEQILQTRIVARLRRDFDCAPFAVPNGGTRGRVEAIRLKESGVVAGHPDLIVYGREGLVVLLEVKAPGGDLSDAQRVVIPDLQSRGFPVFIVDTVEEAVEALRDTGFGPPHPADFLSREAGGF